MTSASESAFESVSGGRVDSSDPFLSNDFYPLKLAHDAVIAALRADESAPDSDLYKRITSVAPSADSRGHLYQALWDDETKGRDDTLNSDKYPPNFGQSLASDNLNDAEYFHNTMSLKNSIPLPPYLRNIIQETRLSSLMGILPQGNMVWVSVDDSIYLWEYGSLTSGGSEKEDFVCFRVPSGQCVVSVGLVKPKLGELFYHGPWSFFLVF
jgi:nuclear pore complex protein Nup155